MTNSLKEAPYHPINGSLLHYVGNGVYYQGQYHSVIWKPNLPFYGDFRIDHMESGRSAKYLIWIPGVWMHADKEIVPTFPMFISDAIDLMKFGKIEKGIVEGEWIVRKRGANYGLARYDGN